MKKYLIFVLVALFSFSVAESQDWSQTLRVSDGLPGTDKIYLSGSYYNFTTPLLSPGVTTDKVRITVTATLNNEASNGNNVVFALSELKVYDKNGNAVEYVASSNADHNSLAYFEDGDGLPALNDDDYTTYFHSMWGYENPVADYHYIELDLQKSVDSFVLEWSTRLGNSKNAPTQVGITLGTEYTPEVVGEEFALGSAVSTLQELSAEKQMFVIKGNAVSSFTTSTGVTYTGSGPLYMRCAEEGDKTASVENAMQLIPVDGERYIIYWPMSGLYLANSASSFNGLNGWQYSTTYLDKAAYVKITAVGNGMFEFQYDGYNSQGEYTLYVGAEMRDGVNSKMKTFDLPHKTFLETGDYTQGYALPIAFGWSIYKAVLDESTMQSLMFSLVEQARNTLQPIIDDANTHILEYGDFDGDWTGEDTALSSVISNTAGSIDRIKNISEIDAIRSALLASLSEYMAVGLKKYERRVEEIQSTAVFSSYPYTEGTYPESSRSILEGIASTIASAKSSAGVYTAEQYESVFQQLEDDITNFESTKITGSTGSGSTEDDDETADVEAIYVYLANGGVDAYTLSSIDGEHYVQNGKLFVPIKDGDIVSYLNEEDDSCSAVKPELPYMTSYKFNNKFNPNLNVDAVADTVSENMHFSLNAIGKWLTASFQLSDDKAVVYVDTVLQESKVTRQSFADKVTYKVTYPGYNIVERVKIQDEIWTNPVVNGDTVEVNLTGSMLSTNKPSQQTNEGLENLLDGNPSTIFHSTWGSANNATLNVNTYIDINLPEALENIQLYYKCRTETRGYNPLVWEIYVSDDGNFWTLARTLDYTTDNMPTGGFGQEYTSPTISLGGSYSKIRILQTRGEYSKNHFVLSELRVYKVLEGSTEEPVKIQDAVYENCRRPFGREYNVSVEWLTDNAIALPRIDIDIEGGQTVTSKSVYLKAKFRITGYGVYENFEDSVQIKGRGNTSWSQSKKPYRLKFADKVKPFGLTKGKSWVLLANAQRGSLMANAISMKIGQMVGAKYTNHIIPVDLYINGVYAGNYMFTEKVGMANNSVDIDEELGYLLELDTYASSDEPIYRTGVYNLPVKINEPDLSEYTADVATARRTAMLEDVREMSSVLLNGGNLESVLDVDALARFYLANDLSLNQEINHPKSTFLFKDESDPEGKLTFGPIWDFDWGYGYETSSSYCYSGSTISNINSSMAANGFWEDITSNETFKKYYYKVWKEFFDNDNMAELEDYIDSYFNYAKNSFQSNAAVWGYSYGFSESDRDRAKEWLATRKDYIYNNLAAYNIDDLIYTIKGDVNCDNFLTIYDVALIVAYLNNEDYGAFNEAKADCDADGTISLDDAALAAELLLESEAPSPTYWYKTPVAASELLAGDVNFASDEVVVPLKIEGSVGEQYKAFQFDFTVPENMFVNDIQPANALEAYFVSYFETELNNYRVVVYSDINELLDATGDIIMNISLGKFDDTAGTMTISNVYAVNGANTEVRFNDLAVLLDASSNALSGDVNGDGVVSVTDIQSVVNLILSAADITDNPAGDVNGDGVISVTDIQSIVNKILNISNSPASRAAAVRSSVERDATGNSLYIEPFSINAGEKKVVEVLLDNPERTFSSLQFDLCLPEGIEVVAGEDGRSVLLSEDRRASQHSLLSAGIGDGSLRVLAYSGSKHEFSGNSGRVMAVTVQASPDLADGVYELSLENIELATLDAISCTPASRSTMITVGGATGIGEVNIEDSGSGVIYDLQGRRVEQITSPGIYIVNGKKVLVK